VEGAEKSIDNASSSQAEQPGDLVAELRAKLKEKDKELEIKNRDLQVLQARLQEAERLAAIGRVVVAVRHEINNPLSVIIGQAQFLRERVKDLPESVQRRITVIEEMSNRINESVKRLRDFK